MEAARQLITLGYCPIIVEKSSSLGGHVGKWHKLFPDMTPARDIISDLEGAISSGANIFLETTVASLNRVKDQYSVALDNGIMILCRAVLIATGFELFPAEKKEEYGYGVYNQVMTNSDLEAWFNKGSDPRIDNRDIQRIGFVHCVGSRDLKAGNSQCSKVCCITAIKQAIEMKEKFPSAQIWCFYMDLRLFGKKYEDFYINAQKDYDIHFIRGRVSEVSETIDGRLVAKAEDTLSGRPLRLTLDLLVLMAGMVCNPRTTELARMVRTEVDTDGFLRSKNNIYNITESTRKGIFFAGTCTGTKTVPETVAEARTAALSIHNYLKGC